MIITEIIMITTITTIITIVNNLLIKYFIEADEFCF